MTNKELSAELAEKPRLYFETVEWKRAEAFLKQYFKRYISGKDGQAVFSATEFQLDWLANLIKEQREQATSELQVELDAQIEVNNRLGGQLEESSVKIGQLQDANEKLQAENERLEKELRAEEFGRAGFEQGVKDAVQVVKAESAQKDAEISALKAQMAGLVGALSAAVVFLRLYPNHLKNNDGEPYGNPVCWIPEVIKNTQATADAYTQEVERRMVDRCIEVVSKNTASTEAWGFEFDCEPQDLIETLQSLIPSSTEKEGGK